MRRTSPAGAALAVAALASLGPGCSMVTPFGTVGALPHGGPVYLAGRVSQSLPSSRDFVEQVHQAMSDVGVAAIDQRRDGSSIVLEGKTGDNRRAVVWVRPDGESTHVSTRFGVLGDEPLSRFFLDRLKSRLGLKPVDPKAQGEARELEIPDRAPNRAAPTPGQAFEKRFEG